MEINNPYIEDKRKLMVALDKEIRNNNQENIGKIKNVLNELEKEERIFLRDTLNQLGEKVESAAIKTSELANDVSRKIEFKDTDIKLQDLYKRSCSLYKGCYNVLLEIREIKKQVRNEIYY